MKCIHENILSKWENPVTHWRGPSVNKGPAVKLVPERFVHEDSSFIYLLLIYSFNTFFSTMVENHLSRTFDFIIKHIDVFQETLLHLCRMLKTIFEKKEKKKHNRKKPSSKNSSLISYTFVLKNWSASLLCGSTWERMPSPSPANSFTALPEREWGQRECELVSLWLEAHSPLWAKTEERNSWWVIVHLM